MDNQPKAPFTNYTLGEKEKDTFTIRINDEERKMIETLMEYFNIKSKGKALKLGARIGLNVLHSTFGPKTLKYLFKKDRIKLEDFE